MPRLARLGAFVVAALIVFTLAIFLIGRQEFLFSNTCRLSSTFDNVGGLPNGAEVRVGGVHVGTVDHIRMPGKPGKQVTVVMNVMSSTRSVIRKDSVASILTEGLLGNKYVSISFGSNGAPAVEDGDVIRGEPPVDISDLIAKGGEVLDSTNAAMKNVEEVSAHLKSVAEKIDTGQGTIGRLVNDRSVYHEVNETVSQARAGVTAFQEDMQALKKNWFFRGFFKDRGYLDSANMGKFEIDRLPEQPPIKKFVSYSKDLFDKPVNANLKDKKSLSQAGQYLQQNAFKLVAVTAYTGYNGNREDNVELSRAQAMVVRKYLVDNFHVDDSRVKSKGMGEDNVSQDGGRIEILVYR